VTEWSKRRADGRAVPAGIEIATPRLRSRSRLGRRVGPLGVLVCVALLCASAAEARDSSARKLGRGFANLGLGVLALPGEVVETTRAQGPFMGATWGLVKGVTMTAVTELVGVWEIVTAPFEFPPDWKPILSPEFPWEHFQEPRDRRGEDAPIRRAPPRVR